MVGRPEIGDQLRLGSGGDAVEHVHLEPLLASDHRRQQAHRPGPGDQHASRFPGAAARADGEGVVPGLGHHAGGLQQHAQQAQAGIDLHCEVGLERVALGAIAVDLLDAVLGVEAVSAHVPLTAGAGLAGDGIGPADDADHQVALRQARPLGRA